MSVDDMWLDSSLLLIRRGRSPLLGVALTFCVGLNLKMGGTIPGIITALMKYSCETL